MKHHYKLLFVVLMAIVLVSCKNDPILFDSSKTFVAFVSSTATVSEDANSVEIPVMVAALKGSPTVTVDFEIVTDGLTNPAAEGTDFTISPDGSLSFADGSGMASLTIHPVDNDVFGGNKTFKIRITGNSKGYDVGSQDVITVTLKDNEHPLAKWIGSYNVEAVSYYSPGAYDEAWAVTTEPDPDDVTVLWISGVAGSTAAPIKAVVNTEEMTITLAPGQSIGDVYGYGNIAVHKGTEAGDDLVLDSPIEGVIEEDGTIKIDLWGEMITEGEYEGYLWDVFNTTWTKQ
jgi:hypothetical protein